MDDKSGYPYDLGNLHSIFFPKRPHGPKFSIVFPSPFLKHLCDPIRSNVTLKSIATSSPATAWTRLQPLGGCFFLVFFMVSHGICQATIM